MVAARSDGDVAVDDPLGHDLATVGRPGHDHGAEPGPAIAVGHAVELGEELGHVVGVGGVLAGIARRPHAGTTAEGVDLQAGVVSHGQLAAEGGDRLGLEAGVALECVGRLGHIGQLCGTGDHVEAGQERTDLRRLVGVGRGQHHPHGRAGGGVARTSA